MITGQGHIAICLFRNITTLSQNKQYPKSYQKQNILSIEKREAPAQESIDAVGKVLGEYVNCEWGDVGNLGQQFYEFFISKGKGNLYFFFYGGGTYPLHPRKGVLPPLIPQ